MTEQNDKLSPWQQCPSVWPTEASFWTWARGVLRRGWARHPVKIAYIEAHRKKIANPKTSSKKTYKEVWGITCETCKKDHVQGNIEIDHKNGHAKFTGLEDVVGYFSHLFMVNFEDLRAVCKPCHKIHSHSENKGISFEEAAIEKAVIAHLKQPTADVVLFLKGHGYYGATNAKVRRMQLMEVYRKMKGKP